MKYTKKQRNEIYRKALDRFYELKNDVVRYDWWEWCLCILLARSTGKYNSYKDEWNYFKSERVIADFPELGLFAQYEGRELVYYWWDKHPFDYDSRENALLFMIEMTK